MFQVCNLLTHVVAVLEGTLELPHNVHVVMPLVTVQVVQSVMAVPQAIEEQYIGFFLAYKFHSLSQKMLQQMSSEFTMLTVADKHILL